MSGKLTTGQRMTRALLRQKRRYERYFKSRENEDRPDNQALSAYIRKWWWS
jgi:hypothetical protein